MDHNAIHSFEIYGSSAKYFAKEKNGDYYKSHFIENDSTLIAMVSDGVSQQPCDWLASKTTCEEFLELYASSSIQNIEEKCQVITQKINNHLLNQQGKCKGMCCTLSLIIWEFPKKQIHLFNIGDSRIYSIQNELITLLTKDDSLKRKKIVQTSIGKREVDSSILTNTVGQLTNKGNYSSLEVERGTTIILATDGFYEAKKASYERSLVSLAKSPNLEIDFKDLISKFEFLAKDDMTAIVIRH